MATTIINIPANKLTRTGAPIDIARLKRQLNIETDDDLDNELLTDLLAVAIAQVEDDTNSDILKTTSEIVLKTNGAQATAYRINKAPLLSVTKIETSANGVDYTEVAATEYEVTTYFLCFIIEFTNAISAEYVKFTFVTGFDDAAEEVYRQTPENIKGAIAVKAADMYDPERQSFNLNTVVENKIYRHLISKHIREYW